jgi:hypothetical protein
VIRHITSVASSGELNANLAVRPGGEAYCLSHNHSVSANRFPLWLMGKALSNGSTFSSRHGTSNPVCNVAYLAITGSFDGPLGARPPPPAAVSVDQASTVQSTTRDSPFRPLVRLHHAWPAGEDREDFNRIRKAHEKRQGDENIPRKKWPTTLYKMGLHQK